VFDFAVSPAFAEALERSAIPLQARRSLILDLCPARKVAWTLLAGELAQAFHYPVGGKCRHPDCPIPQCGLDLARVAQFGVALLDDAMCSPEKQEKNRAMIVIALALTAKGRFSLSLLLH